MGTAILRGISTALLVTVLTLLAGMLWIGMGMGGLSVYSLVDIGLVSSCLIGGYRTGKESGHWILGGIAGAGYVSVSAVLLALFLPLSSWGVVQVLGEGTLLGMIAGAFGAGRGYGSRSTWRSRDWLAPGYGRSRPDWLDYEEVSREPEKDLPNKGHGYFPPEESSAFALNSNQRWWEEDIRKQS